MVAGGLGGRPPSMHRRGDGTLSDASFGPASGRVVAVVECDHGPARARGPHLPCSCIAESCVRAATVLQDVGCRERSLWTRSRCLSVWRLAVEAESLSSAERVGDGGGGLAVQAHDGACKPLEASARPGQPRWGCFPKQEGPPGIAVGSGRGVFQWQRRGVLVGERGTGVSAGELPTSLTLRLITRPHHTDNRV